MVSEEKLEFEAASHAMSELLESLRCCQLATASANEDPLASYAPVYVDSERRFHVYVSAMAKHYANLRKRSKVSLMMIEDEHGCESIFARKRLTVDCQATLMKRESEDWNRIMDEMGKRLGDTLTYLRELKDFDLFRLTPLEGRLVLGFGKAYRVFGERLHEISYLNAGGHKKK